MLNKTGPPATPRQFVDWLSQYHRQPNAFGDLARDAAADPDWPARSDHPGLRNYLEVECEASDACLETFERAWLAWHTEQTNVRR